MTFDDLQQQWQDSNESAAQPLVDADVLLRTCRRTEKFKSKIFRRDFFEIAAAIFVIIMFGKDFFTFSSWMAKTGAFICVCGASFVIYKLQRGRKVHGESRLDLSVLEYCRMEIERVQNQIELLRTIASWYLAPLFVGVNLVFAGLSQSLLDTVVYFITVLLLYWGIYALNQRAVTKQFVPLYEELLSLQKELNEPNNGEPAANT